MEDDWITTTEACRISGYHIERMRELLREGKIKSQKFGTIWMISRGSLISYVEKMRMKGEKSGPKRKKDPGT